MAFSVWVEAVNEEERNGDFDDVIDFKDGYGFFLKEPDHKKEDGYFSDDTEEFDEGEFKIIDGFVVNEEVGHIYMGCYFIIFGVIK